MFEIIPTPVLSFIGFILTISFLVFIHEYGHFWMARRFGVKIEKFSVGFGKPIIKWIGKKDQTEYSLSWIPLGGYVKMYGDTKKDPTDHNTSFPDQTTTTNRSSSGSFFLLSPGKRFLIAFAGPAVNIIFAIAALWILFMVGIPAIKPQIGSISSSSPIHQKISPQDEITAINHNTVSSLTDATIHLIDQIGQSNVVITTKDNNQIKSDHSIDLSSLPKGSELNISGALGFNWAISEIGHRLPAIIKTVKKGSPADIAGLLTNDKIIVVNQQNISTWNEFVTIIQQSSNRKLNIIIQRDLMQQSLRLTPSPHPKNAGVGYVGVSPQMDISQFNQFQITQRFGPIEALSKSVSSNYLQAKLTLKMLARVITGKASTDNLGGPITIADTSGRAIQSGYLTFFSFLAAISLIIAVMNLLPLPILDGGHMLLCLLEMIRKQPLSESSSKLLLTISSVIMITFMLFVISLDLWRYLL